MNHQPEHHLVRRIVLPSGRSIEVVRFFGEPETASRGLHICGRCDGELMQPIAWSEAPGRRWELTLACPNCGWVEVGTYERDQVEELEERLDEGLAEMLEDLRRLTQVNMSEDIDGFVSALHADYILPEDF